MTAVETLNTPRAVRLTTQDFLTLANGGAFENYAKAELIEGEIFVVNAQFRRHAAIRRKLVRQFEDALSARSDGLGVVDECNVDFDGETMPQPDITLTTAVEGDGPIPLPSVGLIVEIADTTADRDLGVKRGLYARHGVPEYWVVDVKGQRIVQAWSPTMDGYAEQRDIRLGDAVHAVTIADLTISTAGV
jgi:Uma2 family endonuclease